MHHGEVYFVDLELEVRFDDGADGVEVDLVGQDIACYDFAFYGLLSFDLLVLFVLLGDGGGCDVEELAGEFLFREDLDGLRVEDVDVVGGGEEHDFLEENGFVPEEDGDFGPCALVDIPEIYALRGDLQFVCGYLELDVELYGYCLVLRSQYKRKHIRVPGEEVPQRCLDIFKDIEPEPDAEFGLFLDEPYVRDELNVLLGLLGLGDFDL